MKKFLTPVVLLVLVLSALFVSTPTRRIGTGILLDNDGRLLVLNSLVENTSNIVVKFPNADNINATKTSDTVSSLLAVLQLKTPPKVKRASIRFSNVFESKNGDYLFALFYPIANTQEDKHILREGNIISSKGPGGDDRFFEMDFRIEPGEGGAALFNGGGEVIGIAISPNDIQRILGSNLKISKIKGYGLKISSIKGLKKVISQRSPSPSSSKKRADLSKGLSHFIEEVQKNIMGTSKN